MIPPLLQSLKLLLIKGVISCYNFPYKEVIKLVKNFEEQLTELTELEDAIRTKKTHLELLHQLERLGIKLDPAAKSYDLKQILLDNGYDDLVQLIDKYVMKE